MHDRVIVFDLDDTLYHEMDYLRSAYKEIATAISETTGTSASEILKVMLVAYADGDNAFQVARDLFATKLSVEDMLTMYRNHRPDISLIRDTQVCLDRLKDHHVLMGLITDGRSIQQRNKIEVLGLYSYMAQEDILVSEEVGYEKPDDRLYLHFMHRYPNLNYCYIGDNISKDFVTPNKLGWDTVCILDQGENIHSQKVNLPDEYLPKKRISQMTEILRYYDLEINNR